VTVTSLPSPEVACLLLTVHILSWSCI